MAFRELKSGRVKNVFMRSEEPMVKFVGRFVKINRAAFGLIGRSPHIIFLIDEDNGLLAMKPATEGAPNAYKVMYDNGVPKAFANKELRAFVAERNAKGKVFVVKRMSLESVGLVEAIVVDLTNWRQANERA